MILATISIVLFALSLFAVIRISGKEELTTKDAKFATILPPIGFGWLIGLIVYLTATKDKFSHDPELKKAASTGTIIGVVTSVALSIITIAAAIAVSFSSIQKIEEAATKNPSKPSISQELKRPSLFEDEDKNSESSNLKTFEGSTFSIKMDCAGSISKQEEASINTTLATCVDIKNGTFLAAETEIPSNFDTSDPQLLETLLNSSADGFFQSAGAQRGETTKVSPTEIIVDGETAAGQKIIIQFSVKETSKGAAVYQIGLLSNDDSRSIFDSYIKTFELK
jgi:hypothetical protein